MGEEGRATAKDEGHEGGLRSGNQNGSCRRVCLRRCRDRAFTQFVSQMPTARSDAKCRAHRRVGRLVFTKSERLKCFRERSCRKLFGYDEGIAELAKDCLAYSKVHKRSYGHDRCRMAFLQEQFGVRDASEPLPLRTLYSTNSSKTIATNRSKAMPRTTAIARCCR